MYVPYVANQVSVVLGLLRQTGRIEESVHDIGQEAGHRCGCPEDGKQHVHINSVAPLLRFKIKQRPRNINKPNPDVKALSNDFQCRCKELNFELLMLCAIYVNEEQKINL